MNGKVVGIIANNPDGLRRRHGRASAARKQTHFIELCDSFHIPLVFFVDVPGFMVGKDAEAAATLREGMRAVYVGLQASVPMFTVVVRKCYGMAGMGATDKNGLDFKIAWPSAEWGSLPIEGGVAAAFRREIAAAPDPKAREREIETELRSMASPFRTAEAFAVEDIIDPRETRALPLPLHRCGPRSNTNHTRTQGTVRRSSLSADRNTNELKRAFKYGRTP